MIPKCPALSPASAEKHKRTRNSVTLEVKLYILTRHEGGGHGMCDVPLVHSPCLCLAQCMVSKLSMSADQVEKAGECISV